jgi:acyl-coenzyme A thioesterase PaaI-like protein
MNDNQIDPALVEDPYPLQKHMGFYITDWSEGYARFELPFEH